MVTICSFDLGIKNLSFCVASFAPDASGAAYLKEIHRWANLNLLADGAESQAQTRCGFAGCSGPASWKLPGGGGLLCKKCVKKGRAGATPVSELGASPTVKELRELLGIAPKTKATKASLLATYEAEWVVPYKAPKAKSVSLQAILAGMEAALDKELPWIGLADRVRIENQPSEFAPHMKSVQMMLFALLSHRLRTEVPGGWSGSIEFANAAVKTRGAGIAAGKATKKDRKAAAIEKVRSILGAGAAMAAFRDDWEKQAKKDDMADALLMCLDGA